MKFFNRDRGVTLMILAIIMIVLLIMAGIAIGTNDKGIISKAVNASVLANEKNEEERITIEICLAKGDAT